MVGADADWVADARQVRRMCAAMVHRGPDDEGVYARGPAGIGMRRLSIIDVAGGHQPIHNEDRTVWVVLNGEIYNFAELRVGLEAGGHRFYTRTDTEVIAHLYEDLGAECVHKLRGMFAFAVWDERRRNLLLARDRLGIKPLHYAQCKGRLLFASEIKSLLAVAPELGATNPVGLLSYFQFGYILDPATAFRGIFKLPPGHLLESSGGELRVRQYWDLPAFGAHSPRSEAACVEEVEQRLAEAVRIRLNSEVPLGAFLSGGIDSSVLVALMARSSSRPVKTFTIGFGHEDFDESAFARMVARRFGTDHTELTVGADIGAVLAALTASLEEPFADSSMIPTYLVSQLARRSVTVALSGDGGDELFAGYEAYRIVLRRAGFDRVPARFWRAYRSHLLPRLPQSVRNRRFATNIALGSTERYLDSQSFLRALDADRELFDDVFLSSVVGARSPLEWKRRFLDCAQSPGLLDRLLYLDSKTFLPADILTKVDRMSMLASVEARMPMLDHLFVEWVTGLSAEWKFRHGRGKYLLRRLAERLGVPRAVIYRRKQGFALPLKHWLRHELRDLLCLIVEPQALQRGYFRRRSLERLLEDHLSGARDRSHLLWQLLIFELWHRNFLSVRAYSRADEGVAGERLAAGRSLRD